jgi:hypothetical protein
MGPKSLISIEKSAYFDYEVTDLGRWHVIAVRNFAHFYLSGTLYESKST